jgi:hypothetical protein
MFSPNGGNFGKSGHTVTEVDLPRGVEAAPGHAPVLVVNMKEISRSIYAKDWMTPFCLCNL